MNYTRPELRHCDRERMRKRDNSTLTSGPDRPARPTRTTTLQRVDHCRQILGSSIIALSASQVVAPLFLHYNWCACRHRSRIGQVHRLPSGSDGVRVVRVASSLLTPLRARLHRQGRRTALNSLPHANLPQVGTFLWQAYTLRTDRRQADRQRTDLLQMDAVAYTLADVDLCLSTASNRRREGGSAWWKAAARALADYAYHDWSTAPRWGREGGSPRMEAAARALLDADYTFLSTPLCIPLVQPPTPTPLPAPALALARGSPPPPAHPPSARPRRG